MRFLTSTFKESSTFPCTEIWTQSVSDTIIGSGRVPDYLPPIYVFVVNPILMVLVNFTYLMNVSKAPTPDFC